jgi:hypothetical protein
MVVLVDVAVSSKLQQDHVMKPLLVTFLTYGVEVSYRPYSKQHN